MKDKNESVDKTIEYERCDLCGELTDIPVDMPIQKRKGYIEGSGQLCQKCYYELYVKKAR